MPQRVTGATVQQEKKEERERERERKGCVDGVLTHHVVLATTFVEFRSRAVVAVAAWVADAWRW